MKIQHFGGNTFLVQGKDTKVVLDPSVGESFASVDFATNSGNASFEGVKEAKKLLTLPGEFEISNVLVMGYYTEGKNVVYKLIVDDVSIVHFGHLTAAPNTKFFENLGENIDVILLPLNETFNDKAAKELIEKLEPRMAILGGNADYFPKLVENMGAKVGEENPIKLSKSGLSDDKTQVVILPLGE